MGGLGGTRPVDVTARNVTCGWIPTELRDQIRGLREDTNQRLEANTQRLDLVETTLLDLAEQQRFVVRYTKALSESETPGSSRA
jgi:hypothetical protein